MTTQNLGTYFFFGILAVISYIIYLMFETYISLLVLSLVITSVTYPIYFKLSSFLGNRSGLAAFISCMLVTIIIIVPLGLAILVITQELISAFKYLSTQFDFSSIEKYIELKNWETLSDFFKENIPFIKLEEIDIKSELSELTKTISAFLVTNTTSLITNISTLLWNMILMLATMFFLYKDGDKLLVWISHISPMPYSYESRIIEKFKDISKSVFLGVFLTAIAQGIVGGIGFAIIGVSPLVFGVAIAAFSLVPLVGTALLWLPAGLILIMIGDTWEGIFIMIWCFLFGMILENYVRPLLIRGKAKLHPFITFLSIMGGIGYFGILGIIFGPLIISIGLILLEIYSEQYRRTLEFMDSK